MALWLMALALALLFVAAVLYVNVRFYRDRRRLSSGERGKLDLPPEERGKLERDCAKHDEVIEGAARIMPKRELLAELYITGSGVEFGALHYPLAVPSGTLVRYADMYDEAALHRAFPDVADIRPIDVVTDLETMAGIDDASQDFVIANHVLEHVEDPLRAIRSLARVLRPGGIAYLALPDKRFTFDKDRRITSLDHVIRDHVEGPDGSVFGHYEEWVRCVDGFSGVEYNTRIALMMRQRSNIHFHVWDYPAMLELFSYVARESDIGLGIESSMSNGSEVIWILRKT